jgi:hypothetical protein
VPTSSARRSRLSLVKVHPSAHEDPEAKAPSTRGSRTFSRPIDKIASPTPPGSSHGPRD